ncbi:uncharacterized protein LOC119284401 [Triticum dicoccoides]|uniref:uncharacterized protein LOC119284401 n=1 Tax=Triticum dicoccoides TaxID=85692 RepID=UPI00188E23E0|nr:uncharacterized protein LOC119284401 [Triticum dicoccoides]
MRRHSVSRVLNFLIWLAYLSADSVAIFVLGHLAVHASGSHHLLIFWAPFLLLHLGGKDTITAFSTHDNELWRRHLLGLVTQASVAGYVISISSWQDRLLLAATVLMFLSGIFKYIGLIGSLLLLSFVVSEDLEELVLGKLIDLGMGDKKCWNFASFRGQIALRRWTAMCTIIDSADLPTSVMIWHTATELCYYGYDRSNNYHQTNKMKVSRELSNYIMYLVFKCDVMLRSSSKLIHSNTCKEINEAGSFPFETFERNLERRQQAATTIRVDIPSSSNNNEPITQVQLLKNNIKALTCPVLPRACTVVGEMGGMSADDRWDLIAEVWLEMLFYIAPRCGSAFHAQHLGTGGEFVTHVLLLMKLLGPFLPPPDA